MMTGQSEHIIIVKMQNFKIVLYTSLTKNDLILNSV